MVDEVVPALGGEDESDEEFEWAGKIQRELGVRVRAPERGDDFADAQADRRHGALTMAWKRGSLRRAANRWSPRAWARVAGLIWMA